MSNGAWTSSTLAELVVDTIGGLWGSTPESAKLDETDVLVVRGADFRNWDAQRARDAAPRRIPIRSLERRRLAPGDLVLEVSGGSPAQPVGRILIIDERAVAQEHPPLICSNFCRKLRLKPSVDPFFVKRQLDWLYRSGHTDRFQTSTTNIRNLQVEEFLRGTSIMLPGRAVQNHLTGLLDRADSSLSASSTHLAAARKTIERLRQAVLAAACSGRLTTEWRDDKHDVLPAQDLVTRIAEKRRARVGRRYKTPANVVEGNDLPDGWCWTTVGALVAVATGATPLRRRDDYYGGTIPWVTSGAVNAGEITSASEFITDLAIRETNAKLFPSGTLLIAMYGEGQTRGRVAELGIDAATNQAVAALLFDDQTDAIRAYLRLFFLENYERIRQLSFGGVQPNLSLGAIRDMALPLPPIAEQEEIVRRALKLLAFADGIRQRIDAATRSIDRTSRAILARAFRGELSPVDRPHET